MDPLFLLLLLPAFLLGFLARTIKPSGLVARLRPGQRLEGEILVLTGRLDALYHEVQALKARPRVVVEEEEEEPA